MFKKHYTLTSALLELTLQCNMQCIHCGSSAGLRREHELSTNEWRNVCVQLSALGCKHVIFTGGEPLLRDDWCDIARCAREYGMKFSLLSNGLAINEDTVHRLQALEPHAVAISIDGATPETHNAIRNVPGSFQRCMSALRLLQAAGVPTSVVTTVHKLNVKELPQLRERLVDTGTAWQIQIGNPMGRFPRDLTLSKEEFYAVALFIASTKKQYSYKEMPITGAHCIGYHSHVLPNVSLSPWDGCHAGINVLSIQSNGDIKGCLSLPDEFIEGNIRNSHLEDLWDTPESFRYNRSFTVNDLHNGCRDCTHGKNCKGGCLSTSLALTETSHANPYCLHRIEEDIITI